MLKKQMKMPWTELEHRIYKDFSEEKIAGKNLLLMVSGGIDSMCLLMVMYRLASALKLNLKVLHCHHGQSLNSDQKKYRDQAQRLVKEVCEDLKIDFFSAVAEKMLSSEAEFRDFRKSSAKEWMFAKNCHYSVWAHQQNDFIETQMLRLIRGAGSEALARPMLFLREQEIRPFLAVSKQEIIDYAQKFSVRFLEDPSNADDAYLRNWMRNTWLPMLEKKQPGALSSLSKSLVLLHDSNEITLPADIWLDVDGNSAISRPLYSTLSVAERRYVIVQALKMRRILNFSHNHILEVMKHLDKSENVHSFRVASLTWTVGNDLILFAANV